MKQWVDKYRPTELNDIISHDHILKIIQNMIENNCIPHLLLNGNKGTGKTSTIQTLITKLYGKEHNIMTLKLNASNHRGIEVVRKEIKSFVTSRMMFSTKPKLVILDEADAMTMDAQLALRRIMDRYNKNAKFCIICNYIRKIHPAIISRCIQFRFKPLNNESMKLRLNYIIQKENINISENTVDKLLSISNNDMRRAIFMLQALSMEKEQTDKQLCMMFKNLTNEQIQECIDIIKLSFEERIDKMITMVNEHGYHLSTIINIYFDYFLKEKHYEKIPKLAQIENQITGEYTIKLQIYALMSIL